MALLVVAVQGAANCIARSDEAGADRKLIRGGGLSIAEVPTHHSRVFILSHTGFSHLTIDEDFGIESLNHLIPVVELSDQEIAQFALKPLNLSAVEVDSLGQVFWNSDLEGVSAFVPFSGAAGELDDLHRCLDKSILTEAAA